MSSCSEFRSVLEDRKIVRDFNFAITLIYAGHDLVSIEPKERFTEFVILCPQFDYDEYYRSYHSAEGLQISNAKAFGETSSFIGRLVRDARRDGIYVNEDFREMLVDEKERKNVEPL